MSCEICGTIEVYGKREKKGKRICIDCWKNSSDRKKQDKKKPESD